MYGKEKYLTLMERCLEAYDEARIARYVDDVKREGLKEHGFARLASNMGILIANGRKTEFSDRFIEIMDICCENMPTTKAANDFTVKEVIFCIMALEEKGLFPEKTAYWRQCLSKVTPDKTYNVIAKTPTDKVHNWACFSAVSEFMRQYIGLADTSEFVDIQIPTQLQWMDENGMYRDPNDPMVYDLVPRGLLALLMHFGYSGKYREEIDGRLRKAGLLTLQMQSVSGEIPYGGRSNQFPHNEAHLAVVCEYEACRYAAEGNTDTARQFKLAVDKALDSIENWLSRKPIRHIKNRFPTETGYGCEDYAYFDKYMITVASFIYVAYLFADDAIEAIDQPRETAVTFTSEHFHKCFLEAGDYFLEFELFSYEKYDEDGLGRIHKKGAPSTLCLSDSMTAAPNFKLDHPRAASMAPGYEKNGETFLALSHLATYRPYATHVENGAASVRMLSEFEDETILSHDYAVSADGVDITVKEATHTGVAPRFSFLAFDFDGEVSTEIEIGETCVSVIYEGWKCTYETNGHIIETGEYAENRNGRYRLFYAAADTELKLHISIGKA